MQKRKPHDPNEIIVKGDIAEVVLYNQKQKPKIKTIIDSEDVKKVKGYKWYLAKNYVSTSIKGKTVRIQHIILGLNQNMLSHIDHIDRNTLNNCKLNLRICTNAENCRNKEISKNNTSGFKGVSWNKALNRWHSYIWKNGKRYHLGYYTNKIKAASEYNKFALKYHGEFARLNNF